MNFNASTRRISRAGEANWTLSQTARFAMGRERLLELSYEGSGLKGNTAFALGPTSRSQWGNGSGKKRLHVDIARNCDASEYLVHRPNWFALVTLLRRVCLMATASQLVAALRRQPIMRR